MAAAAAGICVRLPWPWRATRKCISTCPRPSARFSTSIQRPCCTTGNLSALAQLLPYLDQGALYDRIDLSENGSGARNEPPTSGVNADLLRAHVSVFACPSDDVPQGGTSYRICDGTTHGSGIAWTWGRPLVKVRDGRSQTVFFSERVTGRPGPVRVFAVAGPGADAGAVAGPGADAEGDSGLHRVDLPCSCCRD